MEVRFASSPEYVKAMDTQALRREFLIEDLFRADEVKMVYSHIDRIITGSAVPQSKALKLDAGDALRAKYFLERRELGIINVGGPGKVVVDGQEYALRHRDGMYVGRGSQDITLHSDSADAPAMFYLNCAPAHTAYPTRLIRPEECQQVELCM